MQFTNEIYKDYIKMVHKVNNSVAKKFSIDSEELLGDALEIFCIAVDRFDETRGIQFSTFLYYELKDLHHKAVKFKNLTTVPGDTYQNDMEQEDLYYDTTVLFEEVVGSIEYSYDLTHLYDSIQRNLSTNSQRYLHDLFTGQFENPYNEKGGRPLKFPVPLLQETYNLSRKEVLNIRKEVTQWWQEYQVA